MPTLPKTIYVRWSGDKSDEYLNAQTEPDALIESIGETATVGVYQLVQSGTVKAEVVTTVKPPKRR